MPDIKGISNEFDPLEKLAEGEPYFVLRAQDRLAPLIVRQWAEMAMELGTPQAKIIGALRLANAMQNWPGRKVPD